MEVNLILLKKCPTLPAISKKHSCVCLFYCIAAPPRQRKQLKRENQRSTNLYGIKTTCYECTNRSKISFCYRVGIGGWLEKVNFSPGNTAQTYLLVCKQELFYISGLTVSYGVSVRYLKGNERPHQVTRRACSKNAQFSTTHFRCLSSFCIISVFLVFSPLEHRNLKKKSLFFKKISIGELQCCVNICCIRK